MLTYGLCAYLQVREASQSNPATSAVNVLTVSLRSNVELLPADGIIITIANLRGAGVSNSGGRVDVDRLPGGNGTHATTTYVLNMCSICVLILLLYMCPQTVCA